MELVDRFNVLTDSERDAYAKVIAVTFPTATRAEITADDDGRDLDTVIDLTVLVEDPAFEDGKVSIRMLMIFADS